MEIAYVDEPQLPKYRRIIFGGVRSTSPSIYEKMSDMTNKSFYDEIVNPTQVDNKPQRAIYPVLIQYEISGEQRYIEVTTDKTPKRIN